jgi:hypothetical protein
MHHVLTMPRAWRRNNDDESTTWVPVALESPTAVSHSVVRRVDGVCIISVVKLALIFYGCVFASLAGGVLVVWGAISTFGYVDRFERFMRSIGFRGFELSSDNVVMGLIGVAGACVLLATLLTVAVACAYNVVGRVGHGLVLRMSEPGPRVAVPEPVEDPTPHAA